MASTNIILMLGLLAPILMLFPLCVGIQSWLCKKKEKWMGMVIPTLHLLAFLPICFVLMGFATISTIGSNASFYDENTGEWTVVEENKVESETNPMVLVTAILLVYHIPTVVYIFMYKKGRQRLQSDNLEKMMTQDLE